MSALCCLADIDPAARLRASTKLGRRSRPSAFAVLRLMISWYLFGACTGRSAGFSPLRMRSSQNCLDTFGNEFTHEPRQARVFPICGAPLIVDRPVVCRGLQIQKTQVLQAQFAILRFLKHQAKGVAVFCFLPAIIFSRRCLQLSSTVSSKRPLAGLSRKGGACWLRFWILRAFAKAGFRKAISEPPRAAPRRRVR